MEKYGVVAFGFTCAPASHSEREIAMGAQTLSQKFEAPIFTQICMPIIAGEFDVSYIAQSPDGSPPPTLRICREAVAWARKRGITVLWVVCARPHRWRVKRDLQYAIREAGSDIKIYYEGGRRVPYVEWFWTGSKLWYARGPLRWHLRDTILRLMPFAIYRHIAK